MSDPIVSVIIPVFNAERWLDESIASALAQDERNLQVVLVNDGSTDRSASICERYRASDSRVCFLDGPNRGVSSARNSGIERATGRYVGFLDSDDVLASDWASTMVGLAESSPDAVVVCGYAEEDLISAPSRRREHLYGGGQEVERVPREAAFTLFEKRLLGSAGNKLYRREIVERQRVRFPSEIDTGEDLLFNLAYIQHAPDGFVVVDRALFRYMHRSPTSLLLRFHPRLYECMAPKLRAWEEFVDRCVPEEAAPALRKKLLDLYSYLFVQCLWNAVDSRNSSGWRVRNAYARSIMGDETFQRCMRQGGAIEGSWPMRTIVRLRTALGLQALSTVLRLARGRDRAPGEGSPAGGFS